MNNRVLKSLLVAALVISVQSVSATDTNKTFMAVRPVASLPVLNTTWQERTNAKISDLFGGHIVATSVYGESTKASDLGKWFGAAAGSDDTYQKANEEFDVLSKQMVEFMSTCDASIVARMYLDAFTCYIDKIKQKVSPDVLNFIDDEKNRQGNQSLVFLNAWMFMMQKISESFSRTDLSCAQGIKLAVCQLFLDPEVYAQLMEVIKKNAENLMKNLSEKRTDSGNNSAENDSRLRSLLLETFDNYFDDCVKSVDDLLSKKYNLA